MKEIVSGFDLITAAVWDVANSRLLFADGRRGGVWTVDPDGVVTPVVPHRKGIGGFACHERGGVVVAGRNVAWKDGDQGAVLLELDPSLRLTRFNDLTTDATGRVYVGSIDFDPDDRERRPRPGFLHMIDSDGSAHVLDDGIGTANGLGCTPDGRHLYFADTWAKSVWQYDVRPDGSVGPRQAFLVWPSGELDGLALSADGAVWVAVGDDEVVLVVEPSGTVRRTIAVPTAHLTGVCFGGENGTTLFLTSATSIHRTEVDEPGIVRWPARVDLGT